MLRKLIVIILSSYINFYFGQNFVVKQDTLPKIAEIGTFNIIDQTIKIPLTWDFLLEIERLRHPIEKRIVNIEGILVEIYPKQEQ